MNWKGRILVGFLGMACSLSSLCAQGTSGSSKPLEYPFELRLDIGVIQKIQALSRARWESDLLLWNQSSWLDRYGETLDAKSIGASLFVGLGAASAGIVARDFLKSSKQEIHHLHQFWTDPIAREPFWKRHAFRWRIIRGPDRLAAFHHFREFKKAHALPRPSCRQRLQSFVLGLNILGGLGSGFFLADRLGDQEMVQSLSNASQQVLEASEAQRALVSDAFASKQGMIAEGLADDLILLMRPSMVSDASRSDGLGRQAYMMVLEKSADPVVKISLIEWIEVVGLQPSETRWIGTRPLRLTPEQIRMVFNESLLGMSLNEIVAKDFSHFDIQAAATLFRLALRE